MHIENKVNKHVGNQLRLRRLLMGFSQERLAESLGVTFQQIQKYEKGINRISAGRLYAISRILKSSVSYFFEGLDDHMLDQDSSLAEESSDYEEDVFIKKETVDLLKAYYLVENSHVRKHVLDLIRAIPDKSEYK